MGILYPIFEKNMAIVFLEDLATEEEKKLWGKCMNSFH